MPNRPGAPAAGPPGLAPLLDAERSVLRDHHDRLRVLAEAEQALSLRTLALDDAVKLQHDARRQTRGMRDRLRARELDRRVLTADARREAASAAAAVDAAKVRVLVTDRRLDEIRGLVDARAGEARSTVEAIRRSSDLPASARLYPTIAAFIAENPARAVGDPRHQDLVGEPFGDRWQLEEFGRPWVVTAWRGFWVAPEDDSLGGEVYAIEHSIRPHAARRVWLLGPASDDANTRARAEAMLSSQHERNSLAGLANAISTA